MKLSAFADRRPYGFVAILEAVVILVYLLAGTVAHSMHLANLGLYGIANLSLTIIAALLLTAMRWWKAVGFRSPDKSSDLLYYIVPFLPLVVNLIPGVEVTSTLHLMQILTITLMVGFVEETVFRGLMLNGLKARGFWKAAIITSLLFGLTHAMNLLAGKSVAQDVAQIGYAIALGFAYAALVLKKGLLWPLVLAHFLIDFAYFMQRPGSAFPPVWDLLIVVGMTVIFTAYGIFVMLQKNDESTRR
jgi:uncharacterized protein